MTSTDVNTQPANALIGFKDVNGNHSGTNVGSYITEILDDFKIPRKFHCVGGDNASSNDATLIDALNEHPDIEITDEHRVRCTGHIINLIVQALLYGDGVSNFEQLLMRTAPRDQFALFRKQGVVGRLHNLVNAICSSHKRRELFHQCQRNIRLEQEQHDEEDGKDAALESFTIYNLVRAGGLRWNSTYLMLLRCWQLRDAIDRFTNIWSRKGDKKLDEREGYSTQAGDALQYEEWDQVKEICDFLMPFYEMTLAIEGNGIRGSLGWQIVNLQHLWDHLHTQQSLVFPGSHPWLENAIKFGISKLAEYFDKIVMAPPISTSCVTAALVPRIRLLWFKDHWAQFPRYHKKAEASFREVFKRYLEAEAQQVAAELTEDDFSDDDCLLRRRKLPAGAYEAPSFEATLSVNTELLTGRRSKNKRNKLMAEIEDYLDEANEDIALAEQEPDSPHAILLKGCPIRWWQRVGRRRFPLLYKIAIDYLVIPGTSCECERCFSKAGRLITTDRNRLSAPLIEACMLQKDWITRRVVPSELNNHVDYIRRKHLHRPHEDPPHPLPLTRGLAVPVSAAAD